MLFIAIFDNILREKYFEWDSKTTHYEGLTASVIHYCSLFCIHASQKNIKRITRIICHCALITVDGSRFISEQKKLLDELGWNSFAERTQYLSITMFEKIKLTQIPKIIYEEFFTELPKNVGRNVGELKIIFSKENRIL